MSLAVARALARRLRDELGMEGFATPGDYSAYVERLAPVAEVAGTLERRGRLEHCPDGSAVIWLPVFASPERRQRALIHEGAHLELGHGFARGLRSCGVHPSLVKVATWREEAATRLVERVFRTGEEV